VHFPSSETRRIRRLSYLADVPFILTGDEEYPEAINDYIRLRSLGRLPHGGPDSRIVGQALERGTSEALARALSDFLTWLETEGAHPQLGQIPWTEAKLWHIQELYKDALMQGYWTEAFFINGQPRSISNESLRTRMSRILDCYGHLERGGHIKDLHYTPTLRTLTVAKDDAQHSYRLQARHLTVHQAGGLPKRVRRSPSTVQLPTVEHLTKFFQAISGKAHRLGALIMFETGQRAEEVVENTLLPGLLHQRDLDGRSGWYSGVKWPRGPYKLEYRPDDDRMIGVLPSRKVAFGPGIGSGLGYQFDYKILGKGRVIRRVHLPPNLTRHIWRYFDSPERQALGQKSAATNGVESAHLLLNRFGSKLTYHAIWEAFDAANKRLDASWRITPHELRASFACHFLEQHILQAARDGGLDAGKLTREFVLTVGNSALSTIQLELGHAEFGTTRRYLTQLVDGSVRLSALESWNTFLEGVTADV
jgi:integrase